MEAIIQTHFFLNLISFRGVPPAGFQPPPPDFEPPPDFQPPLDFGLGRKFTQAGRLPHLRLLNLIVLPPIRMMITSRHCSSFTRLCGQAAKKKTGLPSPPSGNRRPACPFFP